MKKRPAKGLATGDLSRFRERSKKPAKRGRPPKPENTRLIQSLIGRQDAQSRRVAARIRALQARHVPRAHCEYLWWLFCEDVHQRMRRFVDDAVAQTGASRAGIQQLVDEALRELGPHPADTPPDPGPCPELVPPFKVRPSRTLAGARARKADLDVRRIDLLASIGEVTHG